MEEVVRRVPRGGSCSGGMLEGLCSGNVVGGCWALCVRGGAGGFLHSDV